HARHRRSVPPRRPRRGAARGQARAGGNAAGHRRAARGRVRPGARAVMNSGGLAAYFWERRSEIAAYTGEHLVLVVLSTLVAVAIGIPLGVALTRRPRLARPVLGFAGVVQTIPSLAPSGFLIPIPFIGGIGARTAIAALIVYALLPILRNTHAGIASVDPAVIESATGLGMTKRQRLWLVELPLALPVV